MDIPQILLLLAAGGVTGLLAGFFGVGGGIILVPILLWAYTSLFGVSTLVATHLSFGTSLLVVIFASLSSAVQYTRNGHVVWRAVAVIGTASVLGALAGAAVAAGLEAKMLQRIFGVVVAAAAVRLLAEGSKKEEEREPNLAIPGLAAIGLVVGLVSSLAGVGGGVFSIPMMYTLLRFPLKRALGTSSATIVITAGAAMTGYVVNGLQEPLMAQYAFTLGYVDYLHAVPIILGTIPLAKLGATLAHRTRAERLRRIYGIFLLVIAVKMFFF